MRAALRQLGRDASLSAVLAGVVATLISFAGPLVIVVQAAAGLPAPLLASWVWAICMGSGVLGIVLSLRHRVPVVIAWSIPGSVLLVSLLPTVDYAVAIGAYLVASALLLVIGLSGAFDRIVARLPPAITAAMLAGVLFGFATKAFVGMAAQVWLVLAMFAAFFIGRRWFAPYAVMAVLVTGVLVAALCGQLQGPLPTMTLTAPVWVAPRFEWQAIVGLGLPLLVVALTGQFLPGIAVLRTAGYARPAASTLLVWSGAASALLAPFGCHGLNPGAVTAALCTGPEAHPRAERRYVAGVSGALAYLLLGSVAGTVVALFSTLPKELVATLAGLALFPSIAHALSTALAAPRERDAALVTFIVGASGMSLLGLGAAFWSLVFGLAAHLLLAWRRPRVLVGVEQPR
ncbi:benzoate/H(+) symporter BenE family transporter [Pseudoxanthomonas winnipegensis]|uniref:Benzoate transporter BenE n=1 Tax=Pseudoxanthomonas winnipegensis TaxID=2480810 RepID=A0A4Q8LST1_9GAMM|nr:benzoate/H(+) symporter BenE family transporter [Pseudoxanthomonas winnipegensis]RZZ84749.1 benzoate transporter BenE [Pseudoxanthomonas winnipegensis]TAA33690.1 benzoate transporter BenE [Pseudoxanthomonas winnipegensis]